MSKIEVIPLVYNPGLLWSCHDVADATDIEQVLADIECVYMRVGYTGIWIKSPDEETLNYLKSELPGLKRKLS